MYWGSAGACCQVASTLDAFGTRFSQFHLQYLCTHMHYMSSGIASSRPAHFGNTFASLYSLHECPDSLKTNDNCKTNIRYLLDTKSYILVSLEPNWRLLCHSVCLQCSWAAYLRIISNSFVFNSYYGIKRSQIRICPSAFHNS